MDKSIIEQKLIERGKILIAIQEINHEREMTRKQVQDKINALIPDELKQELASVDAEFDTSALEKLKAEVEKEITSGVVILKESVKVEGIGQAVFNKGRVTWKTDGLDAFVIIYPELVQFRKQGEAYVTFR